MLVLSIISMISALVLYSVGVWGEKFSGLLKPWHFVLFVAGLVFDTTGTTIMGEIAGKLDFNLHGVTGALAIVLMFLHAGWALFVLLTKNEELRKNFHKFSVAVWGVWLVPFFSGMIIANMR